MNAALSQRVFRTLGRRPRPQLHFSRGGILSPPVKLKSSYVDQKASSAPPSLTGGKVTNGPNPPYPLWANYPFKLPLTSPPRSTIFSSFLPLWVGRSAGRRSSWKSSVYAAFGRISGGAECNGLGLLSLVSDTVDGVQSRRRRAPALSSARPPPARKRHATALTQTTQAVKRRKRLLLFLLHNDS